MPNERIHAAIRTKSQDELCQWLRDNLFQRFAKEKKIEIKEEIKKTILAIGAEFRERRLSPNAPITNPTVGSPEKGMLKTLGYSVGDTQPVPKDVRRVILWYVLNGELPTVGSEAHTAEWGEPSSNERGRKLLNALSSFLSNPAHSHHGTALRQWQEDIDWLTGVSD